MFGRLAPPAPTDTAEIYAIPGSPQEVRLIAGWRVTHVDVVSNSDGTETVIIFMEEKPVPPTVVLATVEVARG